MKRDWLFWVGITYLGLLILAAIFVPLMTHHSYSEQVGRPQLHAGTPGFPLGTDEIGRDVFLRLCYGARISFLVGLTVQFISLVVGVTVGVLGVYAPGWIRSPLMRLTDGMFAFPDILLAILIIGVWKSGVVPVIVALSITAWPSVARLVRGQVASLKDREYVVAAKAMGARPAYLVVKHILPHLVGILMAISMIDLAGTILAESTLSFLGIGVQAPMPSWGSMINGSRAYLNSNPMMLFWPCLVLSMTMFALNFVGDGLREALDPKRTR